MTASATILGCGGSGGMPSIGPYWGRCNPNNPKNIRTRCSIAVAYEGKRFLIDTSPDLREQCLREGLQTFDGIIWTHDHADHTHGMDDVRVLARHAGKPVACYTDAETAASLRQRFAYAFQELGENTFYRPFTDLKIIQPGPIEVSGVPVQVWRQQHGQIHSLGLRFGALAYSTDVSDLSDEAFDALSGVDTWIVDCLCWKKHPTHASWEVVEKWIDRVQPRRVVLTHLGADMDYDEVDAATPDFVEPAFDGMIIRT